MKHFAILILALGTLLFSSACSSEKQPQPARPTWQGENARYIFFFIGDGLGMPQIQAAESYLSAVKKNPVKLICRTFPAQGITTTYARDRFITGSAAAATALACGSKTTINTIAMDEHRRKKLKTLLEYARGKGMKTGIISSVSLDHATPASFYAHVPTRDRYYEIGQQLVNSGIDFCGGGGLKGNLPRKRGKKKDLFKTARSHGYRIIKNRSDWKSVSPEQKVWAVAPQLDSDQALPYAIDRQPGQPSLAEYTAFAIDHLQNNNGFFLMVEGGKIDWACHANDAGAAIHDTIALDKAIREAAAFMEKHPQDTLIVVTGDHETGGLTLGFAGTKYRSAFRILAGQKISFQKFTDKFRKLLARKPANEINLQLFMPLIKKNFGLGHDQLMLRKFEKEQLKKALVRSLRGEKEKGDTRDYLLYGSYEPFVIAVTHLLNNRAGLSWTTYSHTGVPVITCAAGTGAALFNGAYDNTAIFHKIMAVAGFKKQ
ncbi:MAG TPA: alkaline phosphatase [Spirochaetota bacterium]|nr:alkaline phosphatase [Spirochaetota bacterium]